MNKAKYQLGQAIISEDGKGVVSKIFETTKDGYLYEVVRNEEYQLYLEKELQPVEKEKNLEEMTKEELLDVIKTYSNYVDINSKMLKVSIMNISEYINSNKYKDLCNQKDEIREIINESTKGNNNKSQNTDKTSERNLWNTLLEFEDVQHKNPRKVIKISDCNDFKYLKLDNHLSDFFTEDNNSTEKHYDIFKIYSDLKIGDKVLILSNNLKGTIVDIDRRNKIVLVFVPDKCKLYGANITSIRKIKEV